MKVLGTASNGGSHYEAWRLESKAQLHLSAPIVRCGSQMYTALVGQRRSLKRLPPDKLVFTLLDNVRVPFPCLSQRCVYLPQTIGVPGMSG